MNKTTRKYLEAVGRRDLDLELSEKEIRALRSAMKKLASTARLAHTIADRPSKTELYGALAEELAEISDTPAFDVLIRTRLTDLFDDHGEALFAQITPEDIPPEDEDFLRECGMKSPQDEITITTTRLRMGYWPSTAGSENRHRRFASAQIIHLSKQVLAECSQELSVRDQLVPPVQAQPAPKPKKYFNGIGKILSGSVAGIGNVLVGAGAIPATGGAATAGVIASAALSIGLVMQGIGDLRGE